MAVERVINWAGVPLEIHRTRRCRCGANVDLGFSVRDRVPVVIHDAPACERFERMDVNDFLVWNGWATHPN